MSDKLTDLEKRVARIELAIADRLKGLEMTEDIERQYPQTVPTVKKKA